MDGQTAGESGLTGCTDGGLAGRVEGRLDRWMAGHKSCGRWPEQLMKKRLSVRARESGRGSELRAHLERPECVIVLHPISSELLQLSVLHRHDLPRRTV
eukprot:356701-Chlamydomonas_euryale.AAC.4